MTPVPWEPKVSFPSPQGSLRSDGSNGIPNITPDSTDRKGENGTMFTCDLGGRVASVSHRDGVRSVLSSCSALNRSRTVSPHLKKRGKEGVETAWGRLSAPLLVLPLLPPPPAPCSAPLRLHVPDSGSAADPAAAAGGPASGTQMSPRAGQQDGWGGAGGAGSLCSPRRCGAGLRTPEGGAAPRGGELRRHEVWAGRSGRAAAAGWSPMPLSLSESRRGRSRAPSVPPSG